MSDPFGVYEVSKAMMRMSEPLDRGARMVLLNRAAKARKKGNIKGAKRAIGTVRNQRANRELGTPGGWSTAGDRRPNYLP